MKPQQNVIGRLANVLLVLVKNSIRFLKDRNLYLGLYGFAVATAFCPYISGAAITPRWVLMATIPWLLMSDFYYPKMSWQTAAYLLPFLAWMMSTMLWTAQPYDGVGEAIQWCIAVGIILLGTTVENPKSLYLGFGLGVILAYPFNWYAPNPDLVGEAAAVALVACATVRLWLPALGLLVVLGLSHSRGGLLGVCCAATVLAFHRSWKLGAGIMLAGASFIGILIYLGAASDNAERLGIWFDTMAGITLFGHGLGSFRYVFPDFASHINIILGTRPDHAHDDFLEILFETGIVGGFFALVAFGVILARGRHYAETLIVVCTAGLGITNFPFHIPSTLFLAAFAVGRVLRLDALYREHLHGGIPLRSQLHSEGCDEFGAVGAESGSHLPVRLSLSQSADTRGY